MGVCVRGAVAGRVGGESTAVRRAEKDREKRTESKEQGRGRKGTEGREGKGRGESEKRRGEK
jgi:hypothetical protein